MAIRFGVSSTVKNRLPKYSNFWDGTAVYNPFSPTGSYDALATYTVPSGGVSSITFSGLPTSGQYSHLQIRASFSTSTGTDTWVRLNSDTTSNNYISHFLNGNGSSAAAGYLSAGTSAGGYLGYSGSTTSFVGTTLDILDYASTSKNKTLRNLTGYDANGSGQIYLFSSLWLNSSTAISSLTFYTSSGTFNQYSSFAIYGVR